MHNNIKNQLKQKNKELINIVIEKVKKEYENDIDLIGVFGSYFSGDFHEKSDLDLLVVLNNERGWGFSTCFILDDIGYDFYGSPWTKLEKMASFDHTFISNIIDVDIVYCKAPEHRERFMHLRKKALDIINNPLTIEILQKSKKHLDDATLAYGKMMLEEEIGAVRQLSGVVISHLTNTVCFLNHSYFKRGVKHQLEEMLAMKRVPKHFEQCFNGVMYATSVYEIKEATTKLIKTVNEMYNEIEEETLEKPVPTIDKLQGSYEEVWSNWRNKVHYAAEYGDVLLAFSAGVSCQGFYDEMHKACGTSAINLMKNFQAKDMVSFASAFDEAMELYKEAYNRLKMQVLTYDSINAFKKDYLGVDNI